MINVNNARAGTKVLFNEQPYEVIKFEQHAMGRGGSKVHLDMRNLINGSVVSRGFGGNDKLEEADIRYVNVSYLYDDNEYYVFMDSETYEEYFVPKDVVENSQFLFDGMNLDLMMFEDRPINAILPISIELEVVETTDNVKGDTAGSYTKPATLKGGAIVRVPPFVSVGDVLKIDTRDGGKYIERVRK